MYTKIEELYSKVASLGDSGLIAEETATDQVADVLKRSKVVERAVRDGYFSLEEALSNYQVTSLEYQVYQLSKAAPEKNAAADDTIMFTLLVAEIFVEVMQKNPTLVYNLLSVLNKYKGNATQAMAG